MRSSLALLAFLCLVLAGCAGAKPSGASPSPDANPSADVGDVAGSVVDDEQIPLAGVDVAVVEDPALFAISDASGRFRIAGLAPGSYTLNASLAGYQPKLLKVQVLPGETSEATVVLAPIPRPVPYVSSYVADAIIELGVNVMGVYYYDNSSGTQYRDIFFPLGWQAETTVVGVEWTATSPVSAKLVYLGVFLSTPQCVSWCKLVAEKEGRSRLQARVDDVDIAREGRGNLTINPFIAIAPPCVIATVTTCTNHPDAIAQVVQDQRFKVYASVFYVDAAPADYKPFPT